jgi:predicted PurR-regulated permease PerM
MTDKQQKLEVVPPAEEPEEMPLPSDPKVIFLGGLFALALLAAVYVAAEIVLPLVLAVVLKLLLQPAMRLLERWHVPRILAALLLILAVFGTIVGLGAAIAGPASTWAAKLPEGIPRLQERLSFLQAPINTLQRFLQQVEDYGQPVGAPATVSEGGSTLMTKLFTGTRNFASGFFTTILFLLFLLVSGDTFLRRLVEILPSFSNKRQAVDISQQIESDISAYLVTITLMSAAVGIATAMVMWLTGVGDPILWGAVAFLLNFVPILGPIFGVVIFLLANSSDRRRDDNSDASRQAVHPQSRSRHHLARLLVLDVGCSRSDPLRANAGDHENHLRPGSAASCIWTLSRGMTAIHLRVDWAGHPGAGVSRRPGRRVDKLRASKITSTPSH